MCVLDEVEEKLLEIILQNYDGNNEYSAKGDFNQFPKYILDNVDKYFCNLEKKFFISSHELTYSTWNPVSWAVTLTPKGIRYFKDKEEKDAEKAKNQNAQTINITTFNANQSAVAFGDNTAQTVNIDISIEGQYKNIEKYIEEKGGEDKEKLKELFEQIKQLVSKIETLKQIPENKSILNRLSSHLDKHGWFYGAVVNLLGTAVLNVL